MSPVDQIMQMFSGTAINSQTVMTDSLLEGIDRSGTNGPNPFQSVMSITSTSLTENTHLYDQTTDNRTLAALNDKALNDKTILDDFNHVRLNILQQNGISPELSALLKSNRHLLQPQASFAFSSTDTGTLTVNIPGLEDITATLTQDPKGGLALTPNTLLSAQELTQFTNFLSDLSQGTLANDTVVSLQGLNANDQDALDQHDALDQIAVWWSSLQVSENLPSASAALIKPDQGLVLNTSAKAHLLPVDALKTLENLASPENLTSPTAPNPSVDAPITHIRATITPAAALQVSTAALQVGQETPTNRSPEFGSVLQGSSSAKSNSDTQSASLLAPEKIAEKTPTITLEGHLVAAASTLKKGGANLNAPKPAPNANTQTEIAQQALLSTDIPSKDAHQAKVATPQQNTQANSSLNGQHGGYSGQQPEQQSGQQSGQQSEYQSGYRSEHQTSQQSDPHLQSKPVTQGDNGQQAVADKPTQAQTTAPNPTLGQTQALTPERLSTFSDMLEPEKAIANLGNFRSDTTNIMTGTIFAGKADAQAAHQVAQQLNMSLTRALQNGDQKFTLRLNPQEMGRVTVRMQFAQNGMVRAHILVENPETLDLLQKDTRALERAIEAGGHKAQQGSLSFSLDKENGESAGKALAEALLEEKMRDELAARSGESTTLATDENETDHTDIPLDDILAQVSIETGLDVRV